MLIVPIIEAKTEDKMRKFMTILAALALTLAACTGTASGQAEKSEKKSGAGSGICIWISAAGNRNRKGGNSEKLKSKTSLHGAYKSAYHDG